MIALRDRFFPREPVCLSCHSRIIFSRLSSICDDCLQELSFVTRGCLRCGCQLPQSEIAVSCQLCSSQLAKLERIRAPLIYQGKSREILLDLKYNKNKAVAHPLGELMADYWRFSSSSAGRDYLLVPVPLSPQRQRARGFNQARLLGEVVAGETGMMMESLLVRRRNTPPLYHLNNQQRNLVLQGAFHLPVEKISRIINRKILLIDDIVTTGSTLEEAAGVLLTAGACRVSALTAAVAERV